MKKHITLILVLIFTLSSFSVISAEPCTISVSSVNISGEYVEVPIVISNNPGISAIMLEIDFDKSCLIPDSIKAGDVCSSGTFTSNIQQDIPLTFHEIIKVNWFNSSDKTTNGTLFTIMFRVINPKNSEINIYCKEYGVVNKNFESVETVIIDGYVYDYPYSLTAKISSSTVTATVTSSQDCEGTPYIYITAIDSNGNLVYAKKQEVNTSSTKKSYTAKLTGVTKPYKIKVFIWNENMIPLSNTAQINTN